MGTDADIAVVGAGPAGLMAATMATGAGASVVLLESHDWIGGRLGLQVQPLQGPRSIYQGQNGVDFCQRLMDQAMAIGVKVMLNTVVSDLRQVSANPTAFKLSYAGSQEGDGMAKTLEARAAVLATGSWEPRLEFPGSTLPGVMLSGDAQVMVNRHGRLPGRRILMVGSDNAGLLIAGDLLAAGAQVVAVVDESPQVLGREVNVAPLRDAGVAILTSSTLVEARGSRSVQSVTIARLDSTAAKIPGTERSLDVDTICLAGPRRPESRLTTRAGCPLYEIDVMGGPVPVHSRRMATPVPGLYVCGDAAGVENGAVSLESGRLAGLEAASNLGYPRQYAEAQERLARARLGYLRRGSRGQLRRQAKTTLAAEARRVEGRG